MLTQRSPFGRVVTFDYAADGVDGGRRRLGRPAQHLPARPGGRLVAATDGHGHTQHRRYDRWGNPIEIVERGGAVTRQEFDQRARLTRRSLPSGAVGRSRWDAADRVVEVSVSGPDVPAAVTRFAVRRAASGSRRRSSTRKAGSPGSPWPAGW